LWLTTVAINEALRLLRRGRHQRPVGVFLPPMGDEDLSGGMPEPPADSRGVADLEKSARAQPAQRWRDPVHLSLGPFVPVGLRPFVPAIARR
jgi:hypothetical protein